MAKVLVIAGDNLGIKLDQIQYPDFRRIHFPVFVEDTEYRESETHTASWLIGKFRDEDVMARSSQLSKDEIVEVIEANMAKYDLIVHVVMSAGLSKASHIMADEVRTMYKDKIPIINIDTRQTVCGVGVVLLRLVEELKRTQDPEEIERAARKIIDSSFLALALPDLKYLQRGGRIGKAKALMGSLLKIIPVVGMMGDNADGVIVPIGKGRTPAQVNAFIVDTIKGRMGERAVERVRMAALMGFGDNPGAVADLEQRFREGVPCDRVVVGEPHLVEAVHCGPRAWGIAVSLA